MGHGQRTCPRDQGYEPVGLGNRRRHIDLSGPFWLRRSKSDRLLGHDLSAASNSSRESILSWFLSKDWKRSPIAGKVDASGGLSMPLRSASARSKAAAKGGLGCGGVAAGGADDGLGSWKRGTGCWCCCFAPARRLRHQTSGRQTARRCWLRNGVPRCERGRGQFVASSSWMQSSGKLNKPALQRSMDMQASTFAGCCPHQHLPAPCNWFWCGVWCGCESLFTI